MTYQNGIQIRNRYNKVLSFSFRSPACTHQARTCTFQVLEAFRHGDEELLKEYPDLDNSLVWVYFHSNVSEYNRVECWGPLVEAAKGEGNAKEAIHHALEEIEKKWPKELWPGKTCEGPCECCSRHGTLIPVPKTFELLEMQEKQRRST